MAAGRGEEAPQSSARADRGALSSRYRRLWFAALVVFVLAGLTGAFMRYGLVAGFPWGLQFANVRHAHSHTMYFGWVTPALMALIAVRLPLVTERPLSERFIGPIIWSIAGGLLAYVPFLLYGYRPAIIAGVQIPLSVITAGFNVAGWYWFVWLYRQETRGAARNYPLQLWDGALAFLVFATLGAWGLAIVTRLDVQDPFWSLAMTHIFLDTFSYGWFILGVLGVAYVTRPYLAGNQAARWSINLVVMGMPVLFLLGMPLHVVPPAVRWLGALGGLLIAVGLLGHIWVLWPVTEDRTGNWKRWRLPLIFLGLTAVILAVTGLPAAARWAVVSGVRVLYLHWLLLGFVTLGLVTAAQEAWGRTAVAGWRWMAAAVVILILSLIPLTSLWPVALRGDWTRTFAFAAALGPAVAALIMMIKSRKSRTAAG